MARWFKMHKLTTATAGLVGGVAVYMTLNPNQQHPFINKVLTSWTSNTVVSDAARWDYNWDQYETRTSHPK